MVSITLMALPRVFSTDSTVSTQYDSSWDNQGVTPRTVQLNRTLKYMNDLSVQQMMRNNTSPPS